jgi:hypothetical protein
MTRTWLLAAAAALPLALTGQAAHAVLVTGTSTSSFSNLTNCSGGDCALAQSNKQVQWGSTSQFQNLVDPSTLTTASPLAFSGNTTSTLTIGQLTWFNSATLSNQTDDNFNVNWNLSIAFSAPAGSTGDSQTFALNILSPLNPPGDHVTNLTLADLAALNFSIPGVTVSNLQYHVSDVSGSGSTSLTCTAGNCNWENDEGNTAKLTITADFTANSVPVPEPMTLSILGTAMLGLGLVRRMRNRA